MLDHKKAFTYFSSKVPEFCNKFNFGYLIYDPCYIQTKECLVDFLQKVNKNLFQGEKLIIQNEYEEKNVKSDSVTFLFRDKKFSLKIDHKYGHIEVSFFKTIQSLGQLCGKNVYYTNPSAELVSGNASDIKYAWNQGFPIHLDEIDFLHGNVNGKWFKKEESRCTFTLNHSIDINSYQEILIEGLNSYLEDKKKDIRYNKNQIKLYLDHRKLICILLNGAYSGCLKSEENKTILHNGFLNQIFLLNYQSKDPKYSLIHNYPDGKKIQVSFPFNKYFSTFGRIA